MKGKGQRVQKVWDRRRNVGRGREEGKSEAGAPPNRNRGSFPTSLLLLALYHVQQSVSFSSFSFLFFP